MLIPLLFKNILEKNQKLSGIINYTLSQYSEILKENKLYFFEEYTDHGINHINSVLESSSRIITPEITNIFLKDNSDSIGVYLLAAILHDIGMHLTPEGFFVIISGSNDDIRISPLDEKTWKELWNDYLDEARRFGDQEKGNIIGNINWNFRIPEIDKKDKLNGEDKKLIGEFIRRNHPRIAHEIAIKGFPTKEGYISFASDLDPELRNICGLIARSHGIPVRATFNYLISKFQDTWSKPYNIEIIYLMILLRISDYFQIDSSRTPDIIVKLKSFSSPISQNEHYKHLDVKYVQPFVKDPETLIFHCEPRNSNIFIKLQELFKDVQHELDTSWAILGEIYGKEINEKQPKIQYRRIKSNIDNVIEYSKTVNYIPAKNTFKVSQELPKLLIGPLYGNNPTYGVREMLQNAVDACREREFLEQSEYKGEIEITLYSEDDKYFFKIQDNGIGMNLNIIKNYFLEVGSSLRKSTLWKKTFSNEDGQSKIQRSGKFGIGVLAAFLIGHKLRLTTRDSNSSYGLTFSTDLTNDQIEISKVLKESVGTEIIIQVEKNTLDKLKTSAYRFDNWYFLENPKVTYTDKTGIFKNLGIKIKSPGYHDHLDFQWRELYIEGYNKIIWTYSDNFLKNSEIYDNDRGILLSNGILVPEVTDFMEQYYDRSLSKWIKEIKLPFISVFDFNGNLPLNLNRNHLDERVIPFRERLISEIYKDVIAKFLTLDVSFPFQDNLRISNQKFSHSSIKDTDIIFSKDGFILKHDFFIKKNLNHPLLEISPKKDFHSLKNFNIKNSFVFILGNQDFSMTDYQYHANIYYYQGAKFFIRTSMYKKLFDDNYNRYPLTVRKNHTVISSYDDNTEISYYNYQGGIFSLDELSENLVGCNYIIESKLAELSTDLTYVSINILNSLLEDYFKDSDAIIPYDLQKRKEKFSHIFSELDSYIKKYI